MEQRILHVITSEEEHVRFVVCNYYRWERETGASIKIARRNALSVCKSIKRNLHGAYASGWGGIEYGVLPSLFNKWLDNRMKERRIIVDYH